MGIEPGENQMKLRILLLVIFLVGFAGCSSAAPTPPMFDRPQDLEDGLRIGTPQEAEIDPALLWEIVQDLRGGKYGEIHSFLLYKDGLLVVEEYFPGHDYDWAGEDFHGPWVDWDETRRHNIHSVGKSITSACVGIAVEQGLIDSVQDPILKYLPEYQELIRGGREEITIEQLLTMTSGLDWDEWGTSYASGENDVIKLWLDCPDPVACILQKPLVHAPGSTFNYSGGDMVLLGEIVQNASGMDIEAFSWEYLFGPLEINQPPWSRITEDVIYAGGDQLLTPREMLKFGILYLNEGEWAGMRILPAGWVESSTNPYPGPGSQWWNSFLKTIPPGDSSWGRRGYGYTWWDHEFRLGGQSVPVYFALGFGGQRIYILPDQETVVVFTSGNYTSADSTIEILKEQIIPALIHSG
jgi:CubicO group peptidase (beta-lactamase class C family)